ncbi:hypothetical protein HanXRQr2_Chr15g0686251 [Helianthus annuus]|nr:hypothetical protein HanXRQr2_Chr15g0686251 [Helianthus annuus]KAJ0472548.1 hypothetical protein HanHA89_Chr15g0608291 [Helianthus annuus]KAJ0648152.1 hypothetical protein HanLR1_Chr15g0569681 [Helianthus annuus]KAJ0803460.1 hypothetical protein HanOQP8_Chr00c488g0835331 [Helianthus annuus]
MQQTLILFYNSRYICFFSLNLVACNLCSIPLNPHCQTHSIHTIKPPPSHPIPLFHRRLAGVGTTQATGLPSPTRPPSPFVFHALPHDPSSL